MIGGKAKKKVFIYMVLLVLSALFVSADWVTPGLTVDFLDGLYCRTGGNCTFNTVNANITNVNITNTSELQIDSFSDGSVLFVNNSLVEEDYNGFRYNLSERKLTISDGGSPASTVFAGTKLVLIENSAAGDTVRLEMMGGSTGAESIEFCDTTTCNNGFIQYYNNPASNERMRFGVGASDVMTLHDTGCVAIGDTYVTTDCGDDNMIVEGDVGIGKNNPSSALDVVGNVLISQNLSVDTNTLHVDSVNDAVGIGTTSPYTLSKLHLYQSGVLPALLTANDDFIIQNNGAATNSAGMTFITGIRGDGCVAVGDSDADARYRMCYDNQYDTASWRVGGVNNRFVINGTSGDVGIKTSNPAWDLDIVDNQAVLGIDSSGATTDPAYIWLEADRAGAGGIASSIRSYNNGGTPITEIQSVRQTSDTQGELIFKTSDVERMRIDESGFVGIGTNNPAFELEVYDATGSATVEIESDSGAAQLRLDRSSSGTNAITWIRTAGGNDAFYGMTSGGSDFTFTMRDAIDSKWVRTFTIEDNGYEDLLWLDNTGRIGIGNLTTPTTTLDVNGIITGQAVAGEIWIEGSDAAPNSTENITTPMQGDAINLSAVDGSYTLLDETNADGFNQTYHYDGSITQDPGAWSWTGYYFPGNAGHSIDILAWNGSAWETICSDVAGDIYTGDTTNQNYVCQFPTNSSRFLNDNGVNISVVHDTPGSNTHIWASDAAFIEPKDITFSEPGTYYTLSGFQDGFCQNVDCGDDNLTTNYVGAYKVCGTTSFRGTPNMVVHADLFVNNSEVDKVAFSRRLGSNGDVGNAKFCGVYNSTGNDYFQMRFNSDSIGYVQFDHANFNIERLN